MMTTMISQTEMETAKEKILGMFKTKKKKHSEKC